MMVKENRGKDMKPCSKMVYPQMLHAPGGLRRKGK